MKKLFISHSSKDHLIVKSIVTLLERVGFNNSNLFCSSFTEYGIPIGEDIYEYLRQEFQDNELYVLFLLSENYYGSVACLNEMGAAWVLQNGYQTILLPNFDFKNIRGTINFNKIGVRLDSKDVNSRLGQLKNALIREFGLCNIPSETWERFRDEFLQGLESGYRSISLKNSFVFIDDSSDDGKIEIIQKSDDFVKLELDFREFMGRWAGFVVKPPKKDWSMYYDKDYGLVFELLCSGNIQKIYLELKNGSNKEVVGSYIIQPNEGTQKVYISLNEFIPSADAISDLNEIVLLFKKKQVIKQATVSISNMKIK